MDSANILEIRRLATLTTDPRVGSWLLEQASFHDAINTRAATAAAAALPAATATVAPVVAAAAVVPSKIPSPTVHVQPITTYGWDQVLS